MMAAVARPAAHVTLRTLASPTLAVSYADPGALRLTRTGGASVELDAAEIRAVLKLLAMVAPHLEAAK